MDHFDIILANLNFFFEKNPIRKIRQFLRAAGGFFFEIIDLSKGKIDVFDAGREQPCMHKRTLYSTCMYDCVRCACANSRTRPTKTRLEATLPFRTLEMQLQFSLHAGLFISGGMLPSAKAHAYARPILLKYMY